MATARAMTYYTKWRGILSAQFIDWHVHQPIAVGNVYRGLADYSPTVTFGKHSAVPPQLILLAPTTAVDG